MTNGLSPCSSATSRHGLSMRNGRRSAWRLLALRGELLLGHVAAIGVAALEQLVRDLGVARPELRLVIFVPVPIEAEPAHPVEDRVDRLLGRARLVGVLDPQQELAAVVAGEQPVEQGGARAADVQEAGRRGREAGDDRPSNLARLRSSALSSSLHAAMQWTSAPNIAGCASSTACSELLEDADFRAARGAGEAPRGASARSCRRGSSSASAPASRPGSRSTRRAQWAGVPVPRAPAWRLPASLLGSGRAERALGWFALARGARLRPGLGALGMGGAAAARAARGRDVRRPGSKRSSHLAAKGDRPPDRWRPRDAGAAAAGPRVDRSRTSCRPGIAAGATVRLRARLAPPPPMALPGTYDFARDAWFQGIGAVGKALGAGRRSSSRRAERPRRACATGLGRHIRVAAARRARPGSPSRSPPATRMRSARTMPRRCGAAGSRICCRSAGCTSPRWSARRCC